MKKLPIGYYAVQSDFENAPKDRFSYKGITYEVEEGVNLFKNLREVFLNMNDSLPEEVIEGLSYESFSSPVVLFSSGKHSVGVTHKERAPIERSIILLGEGAGVSPNVFSDDPKEAPKLNSERATENETILCGGYDFGILRIASPKVEEVIIDGVSFDNARFADYREDSPECDVKYIFRNIIHISPCGHTFYIAAHYTKDCKYHREIRFENIRLEDFFDCAYGGAFASVSADRIVLDGVCCDGTTQVFGFTGINLKGANCVFNADRTVFEINNCYFSKFTAENGIAFGRSDYEGRAFELYVNNTTFVDASRVGDSPLNPHLDNEKCKLRINGCHFIDTRSNDAAICLSGDGKDIIIENTTFEGFANESKVAAKPITEAPDFIENRKENWVTETADPHTVIGTDSADYSDIEAYYEGCKAYYGDLHVHTDCGHESDGKFPMKDWPARMDEIGIDFVVVVDHRQMRGYFLPEWDEERFIMGTEPAGGITDLKDATSSWFHYNMIFPHKYGLAMVLANFPEFEFKGDELLGRFKYPSFTRERFFELTKYIQSIGGMMVHAHPACLMASPNPLDYYFGEHSYFEAMPWGRGSHCGFRSHDIWVKMLDAGVHVYASGGSDTHGAPANRSVATFYSREKSGKAFFDIMHSADYAVGGVGMKMFIDGNPIGSELVWKEGMTLSLCLDDFYKNWFAENTAYELRIFSDEGLAYSSLYNGKMPQKISLKVEKRRFYRVEIFDVTNGWYIGLSNPIWLDKKEEAETADA